MQDRLRPGENPNKNGNNVGFGMPGSIVDIITISLIVGFFNGLSETLCGNQNFTARSC